MSIKELIEESRKLVLTADYLESIRLRLVSQEEDSATKEFLDRTYRL